MSDGLQQRAEPRRWLLRSGRVTADDGGFSLPCTIVDISDSGARVRVEQRVHLPTSFHLIDTLERIAFRASLVWSAGPEHGLRLLERIDLKRRETSHA
ncbi:MAG TPA: PilZ domain-containing protein [Caulobacteraceae bacterium]|nr:PilZ domain-containing protein [Caulobacteraceae bacterium]